MWQGEAGEDVGGEAEAAAGGAGPGVPAGEGDMGRAEEQGDRGSQVGSQQLYYLYFLHGAS